MSMQYELIKSKYEKEIEESIPQLTEFFKDLFYSYKRAIEAFDAEKEDSMQNKAYLAAVESVLLDLIGDIANIIPNRKDVAPEIMALYDKVWEGNGSGNCLAERSGSHYASIYQTRNEHIVDFFRRSVYTVQEELNRAIEEKHFKFPLEVEY